MSETQSGGNAINTMPDLLAHALAMESEAAERYGELADQMETHRRMDVAAIFRRLEQAERKHLAELTDMCSTIELPHYAPWDFKWGQGATGATGESPETIDVTKVHYRLSVRAAVLLALEHERKATDFFTGIAQNASDSDVQKLARQFADEEQEHIGWLETCLANAGPEVSTLEDPDPPLCQE
jgi:rubrerythrin